MNVKIVAADASPHGTRVLTQDGAAIEGLTGITFRAQVGDVNRAELELYVAEVEVEGVARFYARGKQICRIEYADGTADDFPNA